MYTQNVCEWYTVTARCRGGTEKTTLLCNTSKRAKLAFRYHAYCWRWQFLQVLMGLQPTGSGPVSPKFIASSSTCQ